MIEASHPIAEIWAMTPRQMCGWALLARRRHQRKNAELLAISALGARGEPDEVRRQLKAWNDG